MTGGIIFDQGNNFLRMFRLKSITNLGWGDSNPEEEFRIEKRQLNNFSEQISCVTVYICKSIYYIFFNNNTKERGGGDFWCLREKIKNVKSLHISWHFSLKNLNLYCKFNKTLKHIKSGGKKLIFKKKGANHYKPEFSDLLSESTNLWIWDISWILMRHVVH